MPQPFSWVIWNSVLMFVGAFGAGLAPLAVHFDEARLKMMNLVGAGLMVGTALAVIIPEGADAFFSAFKGEEDGAPHGVIGAALVAGFLVMLALDAVHFEAPSATLHKHDSGEEASVVGLPGFTTLVGILVHSAADGIALAGASFAPSAATGALISLAIIAHKAPTAFGLSAFLLNSGWSWRQVRLGIFLFAAAAPAVALAGRGLLSAVPMFSSPAGVAVCLLLSGGTFLYAACMHILPEALSRGHSHRVAFGQVLAITAGAALPLVFSLYHSHDHGGAADHALSSNDLAAPVAAHTHVHE
mmetsp:Transcript_42387/g.80989  ORF Transcript_42387/g.80989 Transcript_42387/m.80989 type:complete len:301 (+) Transcript_42387:131-1033(+)|eukprot:CAMPEP_0114243112 /NCGR_PEP_ID=MMETSP0058-20121206/10602_1 /TAXON_ID=36894 /ORGANISM="Pyramimonas parkeae, CCMP726" /LENGTH=300 /DNA_ID=CAMNT_0001355903 /DNA_START=131 /DNA_END=1033 /DNA_ORIENTATION=+